MPDLGTEALEKVFYPENNDCLEACSVNRLLFSFPVKERLERIRHNT
jgi:hypothetical protein